MPRRASPWSRCPRGGLVGITGAVTERLGTNHGGGNRRRLSAPTASGEKERTEKADEHERARWAGWHVRGIGATTRGLERLHTKNAPRPNRSVTSPDRTGRRVLQHDSAPGQLVAKAVGLGEVAGGAGLLAERDEPVDVGVAGTGLGDEL